MANILFLVHRLPYPPNKGDKLRAYHLLQHLRKRHRVFLGTFVDDPDDLVHLGVVRALCADVCAVPLVPRHAKVRSLAALAHGEPLTLRYYDSELLHDWVRATTSSQRIDAALVFSSCMAQFTDRCSEVPMLLDLVDVDSAKWAEYATAHSWPMSWVYRREGNRLLAYERQAVSRAQVAFLVTDTEVALFRALAPDCGAKVRALYNGVDSEFFAPDTGRASPFAAAEVPIVFTGAMDYWPNVDAVSWFARDVMPALRRRWANLRLHIVGRNPSAAVNALASDGIVVSGTVADVRPYLQHAAAVIAPLRLARGMQNKVVEAMAMARPVVAAASCAEAIGARHEQHILAAHDARTYLDALTRVLDQRAWSDALGAAGRRFVVANFSWIAKLSALDPFLDAAIGTHRVPMAKSI